MEISKSFFETENPELVNKILDFCNRSIPITGDEKMKYHNELRTLEKEVEDFTGITYLEVLCFLLENEHIPVKVTANIVKNPDLCKAVELLRKRELQIYSEKNQNESN